MSKRFSWLDRQPGEGACEYDKRINELAAFHAGYAFFTWQNYSEEFSAFSVWCVWNGECNNKLSPPLPAGGFMMHCDQTAARELVTLGHGVPVFVKLYAKQGFLHAERLAVADQDRVYDLYFNGCACIPPEDLCFRSYQGDEDVDAAVEQPQPDRKAETRGSYRSGSYHGGSFYAGRSQGGSYRSGSYLGGSFYAGRSQGGSYRGGSYLTGSFYHGAGGGSYLKGSYSGIGTGAGGSYRAVSGLSGSYLRWLFGGSYKNFLSSALSFGGSGYSFGFGSFWTGSYLRGSFLRGSFITGSNFYGSYPSGSFVYGFSPSGSRTYLLNGSFYGGSYHKGSFILGGFTEPGRVIRMSGTADDTVPPSGEYRPWRIIEELGYGLDLI